MRARVPSSSPWHRIARVVLALALAGGAFPLDGLHYLLTPLGIHTPTARVLAFSGIRGGCSIADFNGCNIADASVNVGDGCVMVITWAGSTTSNVTDPDSTDKISATWTVETAVTNTTEVVVSTTIATTGAGGVVTPTLSGSTVVTGYLYCFIPTGALSSITVTASGASLVSDGTNGTTDMVVACPSHTASSGDVLVAASVSTTGAYGTGHTPNANYTEATEETRSYHQYEVGAYSGVCDWTLAAGTETFESAQWKISEGAGGGGGAARSGAQMGIIGQ